MHIGEVCLNTNDVIRLADFHKTLLGIDNGSNDAVHQTLIFEEPQFAIYNDGTRKTDGSRNISLTFTVEDIGAAYQKLLAMGAEIIEPPTVRPWGAVNMSFYDPDRNVIYLRHFPD